MYNLPITLRQPPAPGATTISTTEEVQSNSKIIKLMFKTMNFDSLPDEMVWQILVRVPAQDIFDATVVVCWKWCKMILTRDFKYAHLRHSTPGLLIHNLNERGVTYMTMQQDGKFDISEYSYDFKLLFWASCNGLMLESTFPDHQKLTITNPVTKQHLALPPFFPGVDSGAPDLQSAIAYAATPMEYKVVRIDYVDAKIFQLGHYCAILTVGADNSWRIVDTQHLCPLGRKCFYSKPFVTEGFVHWARWNGNYVLTLNVETEIITMFPGPRGGVGLRYYHFSAGSCVSMLIALSNFKWEVWEMKPETGEWTKMPSIDLEDQKNRICHEHDGSFKPSECALHWELRPVGWLKYPEVMIFIVYKPDSKFGPTQTQLRVAYNVRTQDIHFFKLKLNYFPYLVHRNTLLWLDRC